MRLCLSPIYRTFAVSFPTFNLSLFVSILNIIKEEHFRSSFKRERIEEF